VNVPPPLPAGAFAAPGYEVLGHLHRSNGFDVYDVWSAERGTRAIAKVARPDRLDDVTLRRRLEQEGRLLRRLTHPHIVRGYELVLGPPPVAVTETLGGETLSHLLETTERLSPVEAAVLGIQLASALTYLHGHGYLHLDLKPSNIVVDRGRPVIVDLSIARRPGRARPGLGTWCYLAPEQALGGPITSAADVWGLGVVLFETLAGKPAFGADETGSEAGDWYPQLDGRAPRLSRFRSLPSTLAGAIDASLDPDASRRPSLTALMQALERVPGLGSPRASRAAA
jgi:eukaryotic-like serine/threonine-protein kinase